MGARKRKRRKAQQDRAVAVAAQAVPFNVRCDDCGAQFALAPQERITEEGGMVHFFACPSCGHEYVMARITAHGIELRNRLTEVRSQLQDANGEQRTTLLQQAGQIQWELEAEVAGPGE